MIQSDPFAQIGFNARRRTGGGLMAPFVWLGGLIATALALTVAHEHKGGVFAALALGVGQNGSQKFLGVGL